MQIYAEKMSPYAVTEEDVLWFLRAVEAEGPVHNQVAATLLNGFCFTRSQGQKRTLTGFIRAYAQPVNPRWYLQGDLYLKQMATLNEFERDRAQELALERERGHSVRDKFKLVTQKAVVSALSGLVPIPPNATDYAAHFINAHYRQYRPLAPPVPGINRLWTRPGAQTWTGYRVDPMEAQAWLASLSGIRLERAFDRDFTAEMTKIASFFKENESAYANRTRQISLGEIRLNVGAASNYSRVYTVAIVQKSMNESIAAYQRAQEMVKSRAELYVSGRIFNNANADGWARRTANLMRVASTSPSPETVVNAIGFDFNTGTWVTGDGQKV